MIKTKIAIMEKNGLILAIGVQIIPDHGLILSKYDTREEPKLKQSFTEAGSPDIRTFESQLEESEENGWRVIFEGESPMFNSLMCLN